MLVTYVMLSWAELSSAELSCAELYDGQNLHSLSKAVQHLSRAACCHTSLLLHFTPVTPQVENSMDPSHGTFLHEGVLGDKKNAAPITMAVDEQPSAQGFQVPGPANCQLAGPALRLQSLEL